MKIKLYESQLERVIDEVGFKPFAEKTPFRSHKTKKEGTLWTNKMNIDSYQDYANINKKGSEIFVYLHDGNKTLLKMILRPFMDGYYVHDINSSPDISGKEIGLRLYERFVELMEKPLYSGFLQTVYSRFGIWNKLLKKFPDRVFGVHSGFEYELDNHGGELYAGDCPVYGGHDMEDCEDVRLKFIP